MSHDQFSAQEGNGAPLLQLSNRSPVELLDEAFFVFGNYGVMYSLDRIADYRAALEKMKAAIAELKAEAYG
jgi:hypothetical protein